MSCVVAIPFIYGYSSCAACIRTLIPAWTTLTSVLLWLVNIQYNAPWGSCVLVLYKIELEWVLGIISSRCSTHSSDFEWHDCITVATHPWLEFHVPPHCKSALLDWDLMTWRSFEYSELAIKFKKPVWHDLRGLQSPAFVWSGWMWL